MDTPTDRTPEQHTIPVVVHEPKQVQDCDECDDALFGFHYHGNSLNLTFHLSWWTLWIAVVAIGGIIAAVQGKS